MATASCTHDMTCVVGNEWGERIGKNYHNRVEKRVDDTGIHAGTVG